MRAPRRTVTLILLLTSIFAASGFAAEVARLRNGFTIVHRSRELRGSTMRLYMDEAKKSFVDLPANEIESYSTQPDPAPPAQPPNAQTAQAPAEPNSATAVRKSTDQIVHEASISQGVDSDFIRSVIQQESAGNARAVSRVGARGLMQLMPGTASQLGVEDSFSREQNVHGGTRYLRELLERYHGDAIKALAAYNAGPGAVDRYRGVPPYRETELYVQRVVRQYNRKKQSAARAKATSGAAKVSARPRRQGSTPAAVTKAIPPGGADHGAS
jgi:soluble lytic murein transglycosylase-like protein